MAADISNDRALGGNLCGPGRDLKVVAELGHIAVGLGGAAHFADMARAYSGCEVWQQDFFKLHLPNSYFDGVFANAALFHVPSQELPRVLLDLHASLKPGGVLFSSNPHGHNEEGWNGGRYGVYSPPPVTHRRPTPSPTGVAQTGQQCTPIAL